MTKCESCQYHPWASHRDNKCPITARKEKIEKTLGCFYVGGRIMQLEVHTE